MLNKLIVRNAKRSMKDYLLYLITMGGVAAFMYAFNALLFSDMVQSMWEIAMIMAIMIGFITVFIVLIVAWLINYMVRFMLEKRSREFGTYLLLGMEKKQVSKIYMRENMLLGLTSLAAGLVAGILLQQIVMIIFYQLFSADYHVQIGTSPWCYVMTIGSYMLCYLLALRRNRKVFKKMTISDFMEMETSGEAVETGREKRKQLLFFLSVAYFIVFAYFLFRGKYNSLGVVAAVVLFIIAIYLFYQGLAAFLVCYIRRGGKKIYQRDGLFLFRQLSSKMRTMRFTMGTLTFLFTAAILGGCVSMMFSSYQKEAINNAIPLDIMVFSIDPDESFEREQEFLNQEVEVLQRSIYRIYQNQNSHEMNDYLYTHVSNLNGYFTREDGSLNKEKVKTESYHPYYEYDTYMTLTDYNTQRQMLGYQPVSLGTDQYFIHTKKRILGDIDEERLEQRLEIGNQSYSYGGVYTEAFSQNGMNGADYIFVVPDAASADLTPYYSMMTMDIKGHAPANLQDKLDACYYHSRGRLTEQEALGKAEDMEVAGAGEEEIEEMEAMAKSIIPANGSDEILTMGSYDVAVRDNLSDMFLGIVSTVTFPLAYIALIFVCVAFTILAVQQLSDSARYRYRYDVLRKLGVNEKELKVLILKQLSMYYLIPIAVSLIFSGVIGSFAGERFVHYTGAHNNALSYFGMSVLVFAGVYLLYFAATYFGFKRNVEQVFARME